MILHELKQQTRSYHNHLEQGLALLTRPMTRGDYQQLLRRMWGFYAPLERELARACAASHVLSWDDRWKSPRLERDLLALGLTSLEIDRLPCCRDIPRCSSLAAALGCWYVVEGATLGGQLIARHLYPRLGLTPELGGAFFASYGAQVGPMWQQFCYALTTYATTSERQQAMIQAACETFVTLSQWLFSSDQLVLRPLTAEHRHVAALARE